MKRILVVLVLFALCACLFVGCKSPELYEENRWKGTGFVWIETKGDVNYIYHEDTGVMYAYYSDHGYKGAITVLLNADGTPMIWEGE